MNQDQQQEPSAAFSLPNNSAIQTTLRKNNQAGTNTAQQMPASTPVNLEDTYQTTELRANQIQFGSNKQQPNGGGTDVDIPETCDVKDALILKLEELDNRVYHLIRSNKYFQEEIQAIKADADNEDPEAGILEFQEYIAENEDVLLGFKDQILRIMQAFIKAGTNLERDIYPKMKYKGMYMPQFESDHAIDTELTTSSAAVGTSSNPEQQQSIPAVQTATTFNQVLNEERKQNEATQDQQQVEERNTDNEAGAEQINSVQEQINSCSINDQSNQRQGSNPLTEVYI